MRHAVRKDASTKLKFPMAWWGSVSKRAYII